MSIRIIHFQPMATMPSGIAIFSVSAISALYFSVIPSETYSIGISAGSAPFTRIS